MPSWSAQRPPRPQGTWVSGVTVVVSDRRSASRWYVTRLGLRVLEASGHWVTVGLPGCGAALHLCEVSELEEDPPREPTNTGIVLRLEGDFAQRCRQMEADGVDFSRRLALRPWGHEATIRDPDGNEIVLRPAAELGRPLRGATLAPRAPHPLRAPTTVPRPVRSSRGLPGPADARASTHSSERPGASGRPGAYHRHRAGLA